MAVTLFAHRLLAFKALQFTNLALRVWPESNCYEAKAELSYKLSELVEKVDSCILVLNRPWRSTLKANRPLDEISLSTSATYQPTEDRFGPSSFSIPALN